MLFGFGQCRHWGSLSLQNPLMKLRCSVFLGAALRYCYPCFGCSCSCWFERVSMQTSLFGIIEIGFASRSFVARFAFGFVPFALAPVFGLILVLLSEV